MFFGFPRKHWQNVHACRHPPLSNATTLLSDRKAVQKKGKGFAATFVQFLKKDKSSDERSNLKLQAAEMMGFYGLLRHFIDTRIGARAEIALDHDSYKTACAVMDTMLRMKSAHSSKFSFSFSFSVSVSFFYLFASSPTDCVISSSTLGSVRSDSGTIIHNDLTTLNSCRDQIVHLCRAHASSL